MVKLILVILLVCTAGCAAIQKPLNKDSLLSVGKEVVVVKRVTPGFRAVLRSVTVGLLGPLGALLTNSSEYEAGNLIITQNGISDPAHEISDTLARSMESKYQLKYKGVGTSIVNTDDVSEIVKAYKETPLLIDIETNSWLLVYFPISFNKYRVVYRSSFRLIDTKKVTVLAEGSCQSIPEKTDDAPTFEQLVADGASRLKLELKKATQLCTSEFSTKILGM